MKPRDLPPEGKDIDPWLRGREPGKEFTMRSLVSYQRDEPLVQIAIDDRFVHFSPKQCIEQALWLIECAEAAKSDAFIFKLGVDKLNMPEKDAVGLVAIMREYRAALKERE